MKIFIRYMGIFIVALLLMLVLIYSENTSVIINELNECSSLAMKQTQEKMKDVIINRLNRKTDIFFDNIAYENYYKACFNETVNDYSTYELDINCDSSKGIILVKINVPKYKLVQTKKLLNIVDIKGEGITDYESLFYEYNEVNNKNKAGKTTTNFTKQVLGSWPKIEDGNLHKFKSYEFIVYATNGSAQDDRSIVGPEITVSCIDDNDNIHILDKKKGGNFNKTIIKRNEECNCKLLKLELSKDFVPSEYSIKTNNLVVDRNSNVVETMLKKTEKTKSDIASDFKIEYFYINNVNKITDDSIWKNDNNYQIVLKEYIDLLK